jgi:hypothetical protein
MPRYQHGRLGRGQGHHDLFERAGQRGSVDRHVPEAIGRPLQALHGRALSHRHIGEQMPAERRVRRRRHVAPLALARSRPVRHRSPLGDAAVGHRPGNHRPETRARGRETGCAMIEGHRVLALRVGPDGTPRRHAATHAGRLVEDRDVHVRQPQAGHARRPGDPRADHADTSRRTVRDRLQEMDCVSVHGVMIGS